MSDPMTNAEVEDVLSSIRRLVSEDRRADARDAPEEDTAANRLVLTPSQRIETPEGVELIAEADLTAPMPTPTPDQSAEAYAAEGPEVAELEVSEPEEAEDAREPENFVWHAVHRAAGRDMTRRHSDKQSDEVPAAAEDAPTEDSATEEAPKAAPTLGDKIAALEDLVARRGETWDPDDPGADDYAGTDAPTMDWPETAAEDEAEKAVEDTPEIVLDIAELAAEAVEAEIGEEEPAQAYVEATQDAELIDEAAEPEVITAHEDPAEIEPIVFDAETEGTIDEDVQQPEAEDQDAAELTEEVGEAIEAVFQEAAEPEAAEPETVEPEGFAPEHVEPEAVEPEHVEPEHVEADLVDAEAIEPEAAELEHDDPASFEQDPVEPDPVETTPSQTMSPGESKMETAVANLVSARVAHAVSAVLTVPEEQAEQAAMEESPATAEHAVEETVETADQGQPQVEEADDAPAVNDVAEAVEDVAEFAEAEIVETPDASAEAVSEEMSAPSVEPAGFVHIADDVDAGEPDNVVADDSFDDDVLDEAALRELVSDIVREELQGPLGERITRNVRKLVRREIHRALSARELD